MSVISRRPMAAGLIAFSMVVSLAAQDRELIVSSCEGASNVEVTAICRVNSRWDDANLKMDPAIVEPILDEEFVWVSGAELRPKKAIVDILRTTDVRFSVYESPEATVYLSSTMAYVVGMQNRQTRAPNEGPPQKWRFTRTFVKRGGQWLILSHHYTRL